MLPFMARMALMPVPAEMVFPPVRSTATPMASTGKNWSRIVRPQPEGIRAASAITRSNARKGVLTIVNVNSHYEGSAALTIERFRDELRSTGEDEPRC